MGLQTIMEYILYGCFLFLKKEGCCTISQDVKSLKGGLVYSKRKVRTILRNM